MPNIINSYRNDKKLLPIYMTTAGIDFLQPPVNRPQGTVFHHILFVEDGEGLFETPDERIVLGKGHAIFIRKNYPIRYEAHTPGFKTAWITFKGDAVDGILHYFSAAPFSYCHAPSLYPQIVSSAAMNRPLLPAELLSKAAYDLVVSYFLELKNAHSPSPLIKAKDYIKENYHLDLSVADIAKAAGISQSLLFRLFRDNENTTPIEMLHFVRISRAKQLLTEEKPVYKIEKIATFCGFASTAYFCKVFRQECGCSPSAFREAYKL